MPPNDDPSGPSRRRALGRGPGASRQGAVSHSPPLSGAGGEHPDPGRRPLHDDDGDAAAERAVDSPTPPLPGTGAESSESGRRPPRDDEGDGDGRDGNDGPEGPEAPTTVAPAEAVDSPAPPLPETGAEPAEPGRRPPRDDAGGSPEPDVQALRDRSGGPEAPAAPSVAGGASSRTGPGSDAQHGAGDAAGSGDGRFTVRLVNFEGPFDLLLQLISKHKLDVTEVALSKVTDEFMAYIRAMGPDWDLDQTTEFLVVAATLLDLKAARLLPAAEVEDEADLALLEARDLLFARLLQYRAYKQIADIFDRRLDEEARRYPRTVGLEAHLAELLPEVVISVGAEGFAKLAVKAMQPKAKPQVYVDHIHAPLVSVREQAEVVVAMLRERGRASFRELSEDAPDTLTVVARFLALLELYREKAVALDQDEALGELTVVWAGGGAEAVAVTDEFDQVVEEKQ
ncbi:segregation/condensation protein A [Streptomyces sp. Tu 2975]|uniref:segregation and condensation protein A n=1 Tax=Streptomyces sp. Tu 2975 TaxID=2676871 RepID=UPI0013572573|nr:segregation/condensation protein A [Streptomyces sp. Tu 2975]QIP87182.1 segregation/condensation protein A [Streptomyces sp. Tu 2975]